MFSKCKNSEEHFSPSLLLGFIIVFFLAGCAGNPWSGEFKKAQIKSYKEMLEGRIKAHSVCPSTLDTEVSVTWKTALDTKTFFGYLQLQLPSSIKFVTTNPLGQPIFALVSDGQMFSSVNTLTRQYINGSLISLALRNDIPMQLLNGNWGGWLSGRISASKSEKIVDVRKDTAGRGLWVITDNPKNLMQGKEYILVDPTGNRVLLRILMNTENDPIARMQYGGWQPGNTCQLPTSLKITDLPMGAEVSLHLSDIITNKVFDKDNFTLFPPPGYFIKAFP
jgi:outer membrane lipoprotein-sorting protein